MLTPIDFNKIYQNIRPSRIKVEKVVPSNDHTPKQKPKDEGKSKGQNIDITV